MVLVLGNQFYLTWKNSIVFPREFNILFPWTKNLVLPFSMTHFSIAEEGSDLWHSWQNLSELTWFLGFSLRGVLTHENLDSMGRWLHWGIQFSRSDGDTLSSSGDSSGRQASSANMTSSYFPEIVSEHSDTSLLMPRRITIAIHHQDISMISERSTLHHCHDSCVRFLLLLSDSSLRSMRGILRDSRVYSPIPGTYSGDFRILRGILPRLSIHRQMWDILLDDPLRIPRFLRRPISSLGRDSLHRSE